ncbi:Ig-like domain-containing protein [Paenibacillus roseipurpureus]|uniref:Ig-like domain-containing protein n=1 Tax=Paenibacillus roseopurpureus TaxID=2918901 RepID=A0AA96RMY3_9BACL|nr:Ig-like domain-containing protein [Paenibacillus sp. MBLB1832]WNR46819.1 Ig-like domain-containing protein [Paenibacillus sp. MBLB1832]
MKIKQIKIYRWLLCMILSCSLLMSSVPVALAEIDTSFTEEYKLSGTIFGLVEHWGEGSFDTMFDGKTDTFYDYKEGSGGYAGIDLGANAAKKVTKIRFYPREGDWVIQYRMVGGKFQGSNLSPSSGFEDLYTLDSSVSSGWNEIYLSSNSTYRYLRYLSADGGYVNLAEAEFYTSDQPVPVRMNQMVVNPSNAELLIGETKQLAVSGIFSDGSQLNLTNTASYSSNHPEIASVSNQGLIMAAGPGTATVTISTNGKIKSHNVDVLALPKPWSVSDLVRDVTTGTPFGLPEHWNESTYDKVFDGNLNTFYDYLYGSNGYVGLDFGPGMAKTVTKIKFAARVGNNGRVVGGKFQGSNTSATDDYKDLATVESVIDGWNELLITDPTPYRYIRYYSKPEGYVNLAEMQVLTTPPGSYVLQNGVITGKSAGTDISGTEDSFGFANMPLSGSGDIQVKIGSLQATDKTGAKAGLMIRSDVSAYDSANVMLAITADGKLQFQNRAVKGGDTTMLPVQTAFTPQYLKLVRDGGSVIGYYSADGVVWKQAGNPVIIELPSTAYYGIAMSSGSNSELRLGTFSDLSTRLKPVDVVVDWASDVGNVSPLQYGINLFSAYNPVALSNPAYLQALGTLNPGIVRYHSYSMMGDSATSPDGWIDYANKRWDEAKIKAALSANYYVCGLPVQHGQLYHSIFRSAVN